MTKPFMSALRGPAGGLVAMVAQMNRIENAARVAMGDPGNELAVKTVHNGMTTLVRLTFAAIIVTAILVKSLF